MQIVVLKHDMLCKEADHRMLQSELRLQLPAHLNRPKCSNLTAAAPDTIRCPEHCKGTLPRTLSTQNRMKPRKIR